MLGLPTETQEDVAELVNLARKIRKLMKENHHAGKVILSVNPFIPKPFTPFEKMPLFDEKEIEKVKGTKILVINALREEEHHSHFSLQDALNFIHLVQPEKAYLTHISHLLGFHEEVQKKLPKNVFLAYDNLEVTL